MRVKIVIAILAILSINTGCYNPTSNVKFTDYKPITFEEAERMMESSNPDSLPTKVSFDPKFLIELNDIYRGYKITFIAAQYITDEQVARYRERWHLEVEDPRGKVLNKGTLLIKLRNWWGTIYYLDEAAICPPPSSCDFP